LINDNRKVWLRLTVHRNTLDCALLQWSFTGDTEFLMWI